MLDPEAARATNLERAVFDIMGGVRETTSADSAYFFLAVLAYFSLFAFPVLVLLYAVLAVQRWRRFRRRRSEGRDPSTTHHST